MLNKKSKDEISKSLISTTKMSTCTILLELIYNNEISGKVFSDFEKELLELYNIKKSNGEESTEDTEHDTKKITKTHFDSQLRILRKLDLIESNKLTIVGNKVAARCINGSYDRFVSFIFFKNMYKNSYIFREFIKKIREEKYTLDQIFIDMEKLHGCNKYAINGLKSWLSSLNIFSKLGTKIRIEKWLEDLALKELSTQDLVDFLNSIQKRHESFKVNTLISYLDLEFSNGTLSQSIISEILIKLRDNNIIYYSRGKSDLIYITIKSPVIFENKSLTEYLNLN